jgi:CRP-like cAMP-binding protein
MLPDDPAARAELALRAGLGAGGTANDLDRLIAMARVVVLEPGEALCEVGEAVDRVYQLEAGELHVQIADRELALAPTGMVGLVDLLQRRPHGCTVRAASASRLLEIPADDYLDLLEDSFQLTQQLIESWAIELVDDAMHGVLLAPLIEPGVLVQRRSSMDIELTAVDRIVLLGATAAFEGATMQALANLAASVRERRCVPDEVIIRTGDRREVLAILVRGTAVVELESGIPRRAADLLSHVHELADTARFDVIATAPALLLEIARDDLASCMEEHFELARSLLGYLAATRGKLNALAAAAGSTRPATWC